MGSRLASQRGQAGVVLILVGVLELLLVLLVRAGPENDGFHAPGAPGRQEDL
jgi:hypothetical protein